MSKPEYDPFETPEAFDTFELSGEGMSRDDLDQGGSGLVNVPGMYHFEIQDMIPELDSEKDGKPRTPGLRFDLSVVHEVEGQSPVGALLWHRIYVGGKGGGPPKEGARKQALKFAIAAGVAKEVTTGSTKSIVDSETGKPVNLATFKRAVGNHIIGKVEFEKGTEGYKDQFKINFGQVWNPLDPHVADVSKNLEALQQAGCDVGSVVTPAAIDDPDL